MKSMGWGLANWYLPTALATVHLTYQLIWDPDYSFLGFKNFFTEMLFSKKIAI